MIAASRPVALRPLALLLALLMLVFATVADAATCGSEQAAAIEMDVASSIYHPEAHDQGDQDGSDDPVDQHGVCSHGHCHHGFSLQCYAANVGIQRVTASHSPASFASLHSPSREIVSPPPRS